MPHITLPPGHSPGISGLLIYRPETGDPLRALVEVLLRGPSTLTMGEREIIAAHVSALNNCHFCHSSHAAAACAHLGEGVDLMDAIKDGSFAERCDPKLRALLQLATKVQQGGRQVQPADVEAARSAGATDLEVHDTVLIAAAFCMFNRYVDGLATIAPSDPEFYRTRAESISRDGYSRVNAEFQATRDR